MCLKSGTRQPETIQGLLPDYSGEDQGMDWLDSLVWIIPRLQPNGFGATKCRSRDGRHNSAAIGAQADGVDGISLLTTSQEPVI